MKRFIVTAMALAAVMALVVMATGCSEHKSEVEKRNDQINAVAEEYLETMETLGKESKVPDPDAPVVDIVSVYSLADGKMGLVKNMSDVPEIDDYELTMKLIEFGVLPKGAEVIDIDMQNNVLEFTGTPELDARQSMAVINTFAENMNWKGQITLKVNGEDMLTSGYESDYEEIDEAYKGGADDLDMSAGGPGAQ